ncbi:ABC transporter substrate-binding protein [Thermoanaerobacterium thermosaccharolyticum]|uniref:ABC transporter substrate-binding protein n=2 Tax=Thermoanaerobacterium thermosaccharolyticum TaxID=1517 RepID=A0A231VGK4_THETR|nr:ABC transporter substrate-binding protein [Thermoanaerobacterium thermosaccharolyticum]KAA5806328.1 ABC transporter substrate-binding protein [Thermoanaerobacterium thermosaccharolyticum]OXT07269.1 ABC transporter substrate-binding protein [Thermoanaerobacterium thermosaccharolyticum]
MKKWIKNIVVFIMIAVLSLSLVSCSQKTQEKTATNENTTKTEVKITFPLKITDFMGRQVTIKKEPKRIVSLSPSTTELIYAIGAGKDVVGVTNYDDYPPEVKSVAKVGGYEGPNIEAILAQKPDIVFASNLSGKDQMEALQKSGIPVVVLEAQNINQIYDSIKILGEITGNVEKGNEIINKMKDKIKEINDKVKNLPKVNVFYVVDTNGNWTAGKGTFIDELITLAGGNNVASDANGWAQYSMEKLMQKNPDVIITSQHATNANNIKNMPGYKDTKAAKDGKIFIISNDDIVTKPSNRIVLGLEEIAKDLHPEAFK